MQGISSDKRETESKRQRERGELSAWVRNHNEGFMDYCDLDMKCSLKWLTSWRLVFQGYWEEGRKMRKLSFRVNAEYLIRRHHLKERMSPIEMWLQRGYLVSRCFPFPLLLFLLLSFPHTILFTYFLFVPILGQYSVRRLSDRLFHSHDILIHLWTNEVYLKLCSKINLPSFKEILADTMSQQRKDDELTHIWIGLFIHLKPM